MSQKYKSLVEVPDAAIINRLIELADWICKTSNLPSELSMRVPAEPDRDADLVLTIAADRLTTRRAEVERLKEDNNILTQGKYTQTEIDAGKYRGQKLACILDVCDSAKKLEKAEAENKRLWGVVEDYKRIIRSALISEDCGDYDTAFRNLAKKSEKIDVDLQQLKEK